MRKILIYFTLLLMFSGASATAGDFWDLFNCGRGIKGSGDRVTESRDLDNFTVIEATASFDIYVRVGEEQSLEITFDDNLIDLVTTRIHGHRLKISCEENYLSRRGCRIDITVPELERVKLTGSGDIDVVNLDNERFEFYLSGSGDMRAEGETEELIVKVSGSGDINTRELEAKYVDARVSGSGDIKVYAVESIDAKVTGSGDIDIWGHPEDIRRRVTGSGDISRR
ncbi:MAG: DUF2807 domain-containing protein [Candidatus Marinimicrobia bacterium]|nr:DUF2807 domain-containing protein [Candidatus Neomarinimicrobiota bacterium]